MMKRLWWRWRLRVWQRRHATRTLKLRAMKNQKYTPYYFDDAVKAEREAAYLVEFYQARLTPQLPSACAR